jgi:MurNAc alpha-1-phosphate uridylyltransferase
VRIRWSRESEPLETAGGIATASPLLPPGPALIVSGDINTRFDYRTLAARMDVMAATREPPRAHLVLVPIRRTIRKATLRSKATTSRSPTRRRLTFGNIGIYDMALFAGLPRGVKLRMLPLYRKWIARGIVSGERYDGPWANVGTPADLAELDAALRK